MARSSILPPLAPVDVPPPLDLRRPARRVMAPWWRPRVPRTVYRYLAGEVIRVTVLGVLAVSLLYTALAAYQTVRSGLQLNFVWPLLVKTMAFPLYFSVPVAFLFAITLVLGRMVSDLEVTALRTHGISYTHIYAPVLLLAVCFSGVSYYLNGWVVPDIRYAKRNIQTYILRQLENLGSGVNRTILLPGNEGTLWVESYRGNDLSRVRVDFRTSRRSDVAPSLREHLPAQIPSSLRIIANKGTLEVRPDSTTVILNLRDVQILVPEPVKNATVPNEVFHQRVAITDNVVIPLSFAPRTPGVKDRTNPELLDYMAELQAELRVLVAEKDAWGGGASSDDPDEKPGAEGADRPSRLKSRLAVAKTEYHRRMAFTLSAAAFALLGVSLALMLDRWGRLVPFFAGNLIVIAMYYPLVVLGVYLGENGVWPAVSMAVPNVALLGLAVYLLKKVIRR